MQECYGIERRKKNRFLANEGLIQSRPFLEDEIQDTLEEIQECELELKYGCIGTNYVLRDFAISTRNTKSNQERVIMRKCELEEKLKELIASKRKIDSILQSLPEYQRTMVEQRYYEGKTFEDIGKMVHMSRDSVRRELFRILSNDNIYEVA